MKPRVDEFRKVTVSLGGTCPLACRHCYTTTPTFVRDPDAAIADVINDLRNIKESFSIICVSGDTDPFLDPLTGFALIDALSKNFAWADVMFTTRLIPSGEAFDSLARLANEMAKERRLLIPGVSLVSMKVPNFSERSKRIPTAYARLELLSALSQARMPTLLGLRPTFPFRLVPKEDVEEMICRSRNNATALLGEVFLLDSAGSLERRLGLGTEKGDRKGQMTFMQQPDLWRKRTYDEPVKFAKDVAKREGLPYFLRSGSALQMIRENWDFDSGKLSSPFPAKLTTGTEPDP